MAKEVALWSTTDANNNFDVPDGWPEGMARSSVNDVGRANMGSVRRWYDNPEYLDLTQGATVNKIDSVSIKVLGGDYTTYFTEGRRIKLTGGDVDPFYAHVDSSAVNAGDTDVSLLNPSDLAGVPDESGTFAVTLHSSSGLRNSAFTGAVQFSEVTVLTGVAIQSAIDSLEAVSGGIILLTAGATYIVDEQINIGLGASGGSITIIGDHATLQADDGLDDSVLSISGDHVAFEHVGFDGNRANQTGTADTGTLELLSGATDVIIEWCHFEDSYGHHIKMVSDCEKIWVTGTVMDDAGEDGIKILDPNSNVVDIYIRDCHIANPSDRSGVTKGSCINMAGSGFIAGCTLNGLNHATDTQIGVICAEKKAASPTDQSGHGISVTACQFSGTGANAYGVRLEGRDCGVLGSLFNLSGADSVGVYVNQPLVADVSERHVVSSNRFLDCGAQGVNIDEDGSDITVIGNVIVGCDTGVRNDANCVTISGNTIVEGSTAVSIQPNSFSSLVSSNRIGSTTSDSVVIAGGAEDATVSGNSIASPGGVAVSDSGTGSVVEHNTGTTGADSSKLSAEQTPTVSTTEASIHASLVLTVPTSADGVRQFMVAGALKLDAGVAGGIWNVKIRMGTNSGGTVTLDTAIWAVQARLDTTSDPGVLVSCPGAICTPAAGDTVYWTLSTPAGTIGSTVFGEDSTANEGASDISIARELES